MVNSTNSFVKVSYVPATKVHDAVSLTATGGATPSATSASIDIAGATSVAVSVINGNSTSLDCIIYASYDGLVFDTLAFASLNVGATTNKTLVLAPGPSAIKIKILNNSATATVCSVGINITY